jgi:hypothetical protein
MQIQELEGVSILAGDLGEEWCEDTSRSVRDCRPCTPLSPARMETHRENQYLRVLIPYFLPISEFTCVNIDDSTLCKLNQQYTQFLVMFWRGRMSGRPVGTVFSTVETSFAQVMHISVHKIEAKLVDNRVAGMALDQLHFS